MTLLDPDDTFVAELRARADAEQPRLDLDPVRVVAGGRARRRRRGMRTGGAAALGCAVVLAGVFGSGVLTPPDTEPAHLQVPRPFGDTATVELAPGVVATNIPPTRTVDGDRVQDLGFSSRFTGPDSGTSPGTAVLAVDDDVTATNDAPASELSVSGVEDGRLRPALTVQWLDEETPASFASSPGEWRLTATTAAFGEQLVLGVVPSWLASPRVELFSARGFTMEDGTLRHAVEVPTFRTTASDGHLAFAVHIDAEELGLSTDDRDPEVLVDVVLFSDADGGAFVGNQCAGGGVEGCIKEFGGAFLHATGLLPGAPADAAVTGVPDIDVLTAPLASLATPVTQTWTVKGGRWTVDSVVGDVVVLNNFHTSGPSSFQDGMPWLHAKVGVDLASGAELWRWDHGTDDSPSCSAAREASDLGAGAIECWWDGEGGAGRVSAHDARSGDTLWVRDALAGEFEDHARSGGSTSRVVVGGLVIGPDDAGFTESPDALVALDAATGAEVWHVEDGSVLGTDGASVLITRPVTDGSIEIAALDAATGAVSWSTTVGDDVLDVEVVDGQLFLTKGGSYDDFPLAVSMLVHD